MLRGARPRRWHCAAKLRTCCVSSASQAVDALRLAVLEQRREVARVAARGVRRQPPLGAQALQEPVDAVARAPRSCAARDDGLADDLADADQEVRAHGRQVALGVVARDREQAERGALAERDQHRRAHLAAVGAEQVLALRVADLAAARPRRTRRRSRRSSVPGCRAARRAGAGSTRCRARRSAGSVIRITQRDAPKSSRSEVSSAGDHRAEVARRGAGGA